MPWTPADADKHIEGLSSQQKEAWAAIANQALSDCTKDDGTDCEAKAIRIANARAKTVGKVAKIDTEKRYVFGWAYVAKRADGSQVTDHSTEYVSNMAELEDAVYDYVRESRESNDMHKDEVTGDLIESMVFTKEKYEALGMSQGPEGVWVGYKLTPETFELVKAGKRKAFSIEGSAIRREA